MEKREDGEEEERDGGERDVPKLFSVLLIFSTWKSNSRVFLRTHTHTHTSVYRGGGKKEWKRNMAVRRFVLSGAMKCLIEKRSYRSSNTQYQLP